MISVNLRSAHRYFASGWPTTRRIWVALCFLLLISSDFFANNGERVEIGRITASGGEVFVRTQGNWRVLTNATQPIYSTDKIVTRKGRAEVTLNNGGEVRIDAHTNLSLVILQNTDAFLSAKPNHVIYLNVAQGNVWFKDPGYTHNSIQIRTPTWSAKVKELKNTLEMKVLVSANGETKVGVASGSPANYIAKGDAQTIMDPIPITHNQVLSTDFTALESSNSESPLEKAATDAVQAQMSVMAWTENAASESQKAQDLKQQALEDAASKKQITFAELSRIMASAQVSQVIAKAQLAAIEESLLEAIQLKDAHLTQAIGGSKKLALNHFEKIQQLSERLKYIETGIRETAGNGTNKIETAKIIANAMIAHTSAMSAIVSLDLAISTQSVVILSLADDAFKKNAEYAIEAEKLVQFAQEVENARPTAGNPESVSAQGLGNTEALRFYFKTLSNASFLATTCAQQSAKVAQDAVTQDFRPLGDSIGAVKACQLSQAAQELVRTTSEASKIGKLEQTQLAWQTTEDWITGKTSLNAPVIAPTEETAPQSDKFQDLALASRDPAPPVESLDLGTASPSR